MWTLSFWVKVDYSQNIKLAERSFALFQHNETTFFKLSKWDLDECVQNTSTGDSIMHVELLPLKAMACSAGTKNASSVYD